MKGWLRLAGAVALCLFLSGIPAVSAHVAPTKPTASTPRAPVVTNGQWSVYHRDNAHTGFDPTQSAASGATTGWVSGTFDGQVFASPLVFQGVVYVATLNNTVYALNQADGSTLWFKNLGAPTTGGWICGNVSPQGILGTPVIDTAANRIYVAAFMSTHVWTIFGLDLANSGNIVLQTTIPGNFAGGAFDWKIQQERGALGLANGYVYVPFGGRFGDCNDGSILYQGWVIGVPTNGSGTLIEWNNGGSGGAGIWAPGGVVIDDSTSRIFVTTGNGNCPSSYDNYNDAVVRLSPSLGLEDYFAPQDWHDHWSCNDQDLGSAGTVLLSPTLGFQSGKWGSGFLYNPQSLGGIDGQLFPTPKPATYTELNVCQGLINDANFGAYAYAGPYVYLSCEGNGMVALKVDTAAKTFSQQWNAGTGRVYGPPIVAGGIVLAADCCNGLTGFDAITGGTVFQSSGFGAARFSTPAEAGGQVFVASDNVVREFNLIKACSNPGLTPVPASPQTAGTPVTLTGSVSNCPSPQYRFWIAPPGGGWGIVQDYSASSTYNWTNDTTAGVYRLEVDVRNTGSTATYDSVANITYTINSAAACTSANLTTAPTSPGPTGGTVLMTGSSTGCPNPQYRFWVQDPGRRWSMVQDYSSVNTHSWAFHTTAGSYNMEVDVRDASETVAYDRVFNLTYAVQGCTAANLSASPASPHTAGVMVTLTATSTCGGTPTYRFWIYDAGGTRWSMVQDYSTSTTYTWAATNDTMVGIYRLEIDVRNQGSTEVYEAVFNTTYQMT